MGENKKNILSIPSEDSEIQLFNKQLKYKKHSVKFSENTKKPQCNDKHKYKKSVKINDHNDHNYQNHTNKNIMIEDKEKYRNKHKYRHKNNDESKISSNSSRFLNDVLTSNQSVDLYFDSVINNRKMY